MEEVVSLDCVMQPRHMSAYWHFSEVRQHPIDVRNLEEKRTAVDGVAG
jgi:hypothetical protein